MEKYLTWKNIAMLTVVAIIAMMLAGCGVMRDLPRYW